MVPLAIDTFSLKLGVSGDSILGIFAKGKLPLRCISNLTLGVTNEGREAINQPCSQSSKQDRFSKGWNTQVCIQPLAPNQEFPCKGQGVHLSPRRYLLRVWRRRTLCQ